MKLIDTTDRNGKKAIGKDCVLAYRGNNTYIGWDGCYLNTEQVKQITREDNRVVITTKNNTYILED
ncbi:MAG: hypothetical protein WC179_05015 [Candidatus Cloacimonadaceae bacterium]